MPAQAAEPENEAPEEADDVPSIRPPGQARALNALSIGATLVALGLVAVAAVPAWMRSAPPANIAMMDVSRPSQFRPEGLPPPPAHPSFVEEDEDRAEVERAFPELRDLAAPGDRDSRGAPRDRAHGGVRIDHDSAAHARIGTARHATPLLAEPGDATKMLGHVDANERVQIVKEEGEWLFVIRGTLGGGGDFGAGWIKKSEIAIR